MKKLAFIFFILLISVTNVKSANKQDIIKIWSGVSYSDVKWVSSDLTVFRPDSLKSNGTSVIICPGGSYRYLGIKHEGYEVAKWLNSLGITAFVLKYRVGRYGNHFPTMIQDLQRSIELVRENSKIWNLNPNSVGVMGFSAGGHLVGTSAIYYDENFMKPLGIEPKVSLRPDFVVMIYPVISMHDSIAHSKSKRNLLGPKMTKELENKMSLEDNVHAGMPPIFLVQARGDKTVDYRNASYFYQQLVKKQISSHYLLYECEGHGFGIDPNRNKEASQWIYDFEKWYIDLEKN